MGNNDMLAVCNTKKMLSYWSCYTFLTKGKKKAALKMFLVDTYLYFVHKICTLCQFSGILCDKRIEKDICLLFTDILIYHIEVCVLNF